MKKHVPTKPRFKYAQIQGRDFFKSLNLNPPVNPFDIIKGNPLWSLKIEHLHGEEGYTLRNNDKYRIVIDTNVYSKRLRFTIFHEIGHIILGHFTDFDNFTLTQNEYNILDIEANVFAGEVLMPEKHIINSGLRTTSELMDYFQVSKLALKTRLAFLGLNSLIKDPEDLLSENSWSSDLSLEQYLYKKELFQDNW